MSCNVLILTSGAAAVQAAYGKSVAFDIGDLIHLNYNSTLCDFGTNDYTVEFYVCWPTNLLPSTDQTFWSLGYNTGTNYTPYFRIYYTNGQFVVEEADTTRILWQLRSNTFTPAANQWYHIALVRRANYIYLYVDGTVRSSGPYSAAHITGMPMDIGVLNYRGGNVTPFAGNLSNLRVTKYAVYTTTFTPPKQALTSYPETVLLACQDNPLVDNSAYHWPMSANGTTPISDNRSPFA